MLVSAVRFDNTTFIDLYPLKSKSTVSVDCHFSLQRTYTIFRTLGLRHLVVTGAPLDRSTIHQQVQGIITRKDLMGFEMEDRIMEGAITQEEAEKWQSDHEDTAWSPQHESQHSNIGSFTYRNESTRGT